MAQVFAITSTERSVFDVNAPSAAAINAAVVGITIGQGGALVGPPRIVRRALTTIGRPWETQVTFLFSFPDPRPGAAPMRASDLQNVLDDRQSTNHSVLPGGDWTGFTVTPYSPTINGPIAWWQSGEAAQTQTRDAFPTGAARFDTPQNPIGPDSPDVRPSSPADAARSLTSLLWIAGGIAVAVTVLPPLLSAITAASSTRRLARRNPTRVTVRRRSRR